MQVIQYNILGKLDEAKAIEAHLDIKPRVIDGCGAAHSNR